MSRFLLDVNVVLALVDSKHTLHSAAHRWAAAEPAAMWMTCPIVQNGAVRVGSQPAYYPRLGSQAAVREAVRAMCASPRHRFCPDDISLFDRGCIARPEVLTPARITDLYLLALAHHHGAQLATFDHRIPADAVVGGPAALAVIDA